MKPDLRDWHVYGGLMLVGYGVWTVAGPCALAVVGVGLFYLGVWRAK